ncbi:MAG: hypothetical protein KDJ44_02400, partial [Rhodoblastus sp.]|nr:hypothetical protein [Rhodoblastus sp.]
MAQPMVNLAAVRAASHPAMLKAATSNRAMKIARSPVCIGSRSDFRQQHGCRDDDEGKAGKE